MKQKIELFILAVIFSYCTGCFSGDEGQESKKINKDFWIDWIGSVRYQMLLQANDTTGLEHGGNIMVGMMVYAVGSNNDFVIVKQHPDFVAADDMTLVGKSNELVYRLRDPADSMYLPKKDKAFMWDSTWYHTGAGWANGEPDSTFKRLTFYYIFDIRKYKMGDDKSYTMYKCKTLASFNEKREELGVPENLDFTIINKEPE